MSARLWYLVSPLSIGKQVLSAFVATSFITLCLSFAHTVVTLYDHNRGHWTDVKLGNIFHALLKDRMTEKRRGEVKAVLEAVILNLSDQQVLVGLAMLLAGIIRVCSISAYHFTIISDLGWFASNTHLVTLNALQFHFRLSEHHVQRDWRVVLILLIFVFMATFQILQANGAWYDSYSSHAKCLFDDLIGNVYGDPARWMGVNLFFLLTSYPKAIVSLFRSVSDSYEKWLYEKPAIFLDDQIALKPLKGGILHHIEKAFWALLRLLHHVLVLFDDSRVVNWLFNAASFGWGLQSVIGDRWPSPDDENELGFGQLVPMFLLVSTIFVAREVWDGKILFARPCIACEKLNHTHRQDSLKANGINVVAFGYHRRWPQVCGVRD